MSSFFQFLQSALPSVLSASLSAAAIVIVVQALVWLTRFRLPPQWCHALWLIAFVRLALPALPEVPRSITPPKPTEAAVSQYISTLAQPRSTPLGSPEESPHAGGPSLIYQPSPLSIPSAASLSPAPAQPWSWRERLALVWAAGVAAVFGVMTLGAWLTLRRWRHLSLPPAERVSHIFEKLCDDLRLRRRPSLMLCPVLAAPVVAGLWRPRILLPVHVTENFSAEQLRHVLAHEIAHLRRRDLWLHTAVAILQAIHWFNPTVWFAAHRLRAAAERCCDEWALRHLALSEGRTYADTLLRVLERPVRSWALPGIAAMAESKADLRQRIRALARWGIVPRRWVFTSAVLLALLAFCALTVPAIEKDEEPKKAKATSFAEIPFKVIDSERRPLKGAIIYMNGIRIAEAPGDGIGWPAMPDLPSEFVTGSDGIARIKYPRQTGTERHTTRMMFGIHAPGHVPLAYHEVGVEKAPEPFQLDTGATLQVRAFREPKDKPEQNIEIQYGTGQEKLSWQQQPDGSMLSTQLPPGDVKLRIVWKDPVSNDFWFSRVTTTALQRGKEHHLDVALLRAVTLKGSLDATVPRPVRGGHIRANFSPPGMRDQFGFHRNAASNSVAEDGSFLLNDCPPGDEAYVAAGCEGFFSTVPGQSEQYMQTATHVVAAQIKEPLILMMRPTASVEITALNPEGKPAEGIYVSISPNTTFGNFATMYGTAPYNFKTNAQGKVHFKDVPECTVSINTHSESLELPAVDEYQTGQWRRSKNVTCKSGESISITLQLVRVGTTPLPAPTGRSQAGNTDTPPRLYSYAPQTASTVSPNPQILAEPVEADEFAGVVLDGKGHPIAKAHVLSYGLDDEKWMETDAQGRFRYRLPAAKGAPTTDLVRIHAKGCSPITLFEQPTGVYGFITMTGGTSLEGVVKDASGKPAKDVVIRMEQATKCGKVGSQMICQRMPYREAKTGADGRYKILAESDYYKVTVYGNDLGTCEHKDVWLTKGESRVFDFLADPNLKIEAEFVDAETSRPVPGAELRCYFFKQEKLWKADDKGRLVISGLLPGVCEFNPQHPDYARWWCDDATNPWQRFEPINNPKTKWQRNFDDLSLDVRTADKPFKIVMERGVIFRGRVLDPDGRPVEGATVDPAQTSTGNSLTGDTRFSVRTDAEGRYELRIPASNAAQYNLVAHDGKYQEWRRWANGVLPAVRTKPGEVYENVDITLTRPGIIRGVVLDAEGKPVAGQRVRACPEDFSENRYYDPETTTDKDGRFQLSFVRPTRQYLWASKWNHDPADVPEKYRPILDVKTGETLEVTAYHYVR